MFISMLDIFKQRWGEFIRYRFFQRWIFAILDGMNSKFHAILEDIVYACIESFRDHILSATVGTTWLFKLI